MTTKQQTALKARKDLGFVHVCQLDRSHIAALRSDWISPSGTPAHRVSRVLKAAIEVARLGTTRRAEHTLDIYVGGVPLRIPLHDLVKAVGSGYAPVPWRLRAPKRGYDKDTSPEVDWVGPRRLVVGDAELRVDELRPEAANKVAKYIDDARWRYDGDEETTRPSGFWRDLALDLDAIHHGGLYTATLELRRTGLVASAVSEVDGKAFNEVRITPDGEVRGPVEVASFAGVALSRILRVAAATAGKDGEVTAHVSTDHPLLLEWKCDDIGVEVLLAPTVEH